MRYTASQALISAVLFTQLQHKTLYLYCWCYLVLLALSGCYVNDLDYPQIRGQDVPVHSDRYSLMWCPVFCLRSTHKIFYLSVFKHALGNFYILSIVQKVVCLTNSVPGKAFTLLPDATHINLTTV